MSPSHLLLAVISATVPVAQSVTSPMSKAQTRVDDTVGNSLSIDVQSTGYTATHLESENEDFDEAGDMSGGLREVVANATEVPTGGASDHQSAQSTSNEGKVVAELSTKAQKGPGYEMVDVDNDDNRTAYACAGQDCSTFISLCCQKFWDFKNNLESRIKNNGWDRSLGLSDVNVIVQQDYQLNKCKQSNSPAYWWWLSTWAGRSWCVQGKCASFKSELNQCDASSTASSCPGNCKHQSQNCCNTRSDCKWRRKKGKCKNNNLLVEESNGTDSEEEETQEESEEGEPMMRSRPAGASLQRQGEDEQAGSMEESLAGKRSC